MKVKSIKSKAILSLAIFALTIGLVWLAMSVIDKASAEDNQANEINALPNVTYTMNPEQCGDYCYQSWGKKGSGSYINLSFSDEDSSFALNAVAENPDPDFSLYGEISVDKTEAMSGGWEFQGVFINNEPISLDQKIYEDCNLEFRFKEAPDSLTIALNSKFGPLQEEGYSVKVYDKNHNFYSSATTDSNGKAKFDDISIEDLSGGYAWLEKEGWSDGVVYLPSYVFESKPYQAGTVVCEERDIDFYINSSNSAHDYFAEHIYCLSPAYEYDCDSFYNNGNFCYFRKLSSVYSVSEEGSLKIHHEEAFRTTDNTYTAISVDQRPVLYWHIDYGNNESIDLHPGDDPLDLTSAFFFNINIEPVYGDAPQPGPEPTPTPTPAEEVNSAQTGDSCEAVLPLAILAVLAAGAVLYSRKRAMHK